MRKGNSCNSAENKILSDVKKIIASYKMIEPYDSLIVGVSGGPDSVALLHVLLKIAPQFFLKLGVAHLNHSLRAQDSDNDAAFVKSMCLKLNLPLFIKKVDVQKYRKANKVSIEEAARKVRYTFFSDLLRKEGFNKIALGHHLDDNAELILMNIFRGSGHLGVSGMPPVRNIIGPGKKIVRPLICLKKSDIINYLSEKGLKYVMDKSNEDINYTRNRIRVDLIPYLEKNFNPKISETLNRFAFILRSEEEWKNAMVADLFEKSLSSLHDHLISFYVNNLLKLHPAAKRMVIRKGIESVKKDLRRITFKHVDFAVGLLEKRSPNWSMDLPEGVKIFRKYEKLYILQSRKDSAKDLSDKKELLPFKYEIDKPESGQIIIKHIKERDLYLRLSESCVDDLADILNAGHMTAFFDMDALRFPLELRNLVPGDRFSPLGVKGSQKVKKFFINKKIPLFERERSSVLLSGGKVIWVAGYQIDDFVKVTPFTENVLKIEIIQST